MIAETAHTYQQLAIRPASLGVLQERRDVAGGLAPERARETGHLPYHTATAQQE